MTNLHCLCEKQTRQEQNIFSLYLSFSCYCFVNNSNTFSEMNFNNNDDFEIGIEEIL